MSSSEFKKQKISKLEKFDKISFDSWTVVIRYLSSSKDLFAAYLVVKGLFQYAMRFDSCMENIEFWRSRFDKNDRFELPTEPKKYVRILFIRLKQRPSILNVIFPNLRKFVGEWIPSHLFSSNTIENLDLCPRMNDELKGKFFQMGLLPRLRILRSGFEDLPSDQVLNLDDHVVRVSSKEMVCPEVETLSLTMVDVIHYPFIGLKSKLRDLELIGSCFMHSVQGKLDPEYFSLDESYGELRNVHISEVNTVGKISGCPKLEKLEMKMAGLGDFLELNMKEISNLPELKELSYVMGKHLDYDRLEKMKNIPNLKKIHVSVRRDFTLENIGTNGTLEEFRIFVEDSAVVKFKNVVIGKKIRVVEIKNEVFSGKVNLKDSQNVRKLKKMGITVLK